MKKALIIFVRNPLPGKVKTRLAQTIGNARALDIYKLLLARTMLVSSHVLCTRFVYYSDFVNEEDEWNNSLYRKKLQRGNDLGTRMKNAFREIFSAGYEYVAIIGSDCYQLTAEIIESGFEKLHSADASIGPSHDGGYYFLGLKNMCEKIFEDKSWSTDKVLSDTIRDLEAKGLSYSLLQTLHDIDVEADLHFLDRSM